MAQEDVEDFDSEILAVADEAQLAKQKEMRFWYEQEEKRKARLARSEIANTVEQQTADEARVPVAPKSPATIGTPEDEQEGFGFWASEAGSAIFGGARDSAQELIETGSDLLGQDEPLAVLPEINANETAIGEGARGMVQFMAGFIPAIGVVGKVGKVARAAGNALTKSKKADKVLDGTGGDLVKFAAAGAVADGAGTDPHQERIANLFVDLEERDPEAEKSLMEWLAADPTDTKAEGRLKNVVEGLALGGAADGLIKGLKVLKGSFDEGRPSKFTKLKEQVKAKRKAIKDKEAEGKPEVKPEGEEPSLAGKETGELDANNKPVHYLDDSSNVGDVIKTIDDGATPNLAPRAATKAGKKVESKRVITPKGVERLSQAITKGDSDGVVKALNDDGVNLNHVDDLVGLEEAISQIATKIAKGAGKVETQAMVLKVAKSAGMNKKRIASLRDDTAELGARMVAANALNIIQHKEAVKLMQNAVAEPTAANIVAADKALDVFASLRAEMNGTRRQMAQGFNHLRLIKGDSDARAAGKLADILEASGGTEANINAFKKMIMSSKKPDDLGKHFEKSIFKRTNSMALEVVINGMLSGPQTHMINGLSNFLVSTMDIVEHAGAAGINKIGLGVRNTNNAVGNEALTGGAVAARTMGMFRGVSRAMHISAEGIKAAREAAGRAASGDFKGAKSTIVENQDEYGTIFHSAAKSESMIDPLGKHKTEQGANEIDAITAENMGLSSENWAGWAVNVMGSAVRVSGRALVTADELFKSVAYTGEMAQQAYAMATREGLVPNSKAFAKRMMDIEKNPPEFLRKQALKVARENTFTNPLGEVGRNLTNVVNKIPLFRYIAPFIRTPTNILKYAGTRTPYVRMMAKSVKDDLAAGGARADLANSKMVITSTVYTMAALGVAAGNISGAGGGGNKKSQRAAGWQPYSIRVDGKWYAYDRLDPISIPLGIAASFIEMGESQSEADMTERMSDAMVGALEFASDKAWFAGVIELLSIIDRGNGAALGDYMKQYANVLVPFSSARRVIARNSDERMMEQYTWLDTIASNTSGDWGLDKQKVDDFGELRDNAEHFGPKWLSPIKTSTESADPAKQELARLDIQFAKVRRKIGDGKHTSGVELDAEQYQRYQQLIGKDAIVGGKGFKEALDALVDSSYYQNLPEDTDFAKEHGSLKEDKIRKLRTRYKKAAERQLAEEYPSLKQALQDDVYNTRFKLKGIAIPQWLLDARDEKPR